MLKSSIAKPDHIPELWVADPDFTPAPLAPVSSDTPTPTPWATDVSAASPTTDPTSSPIINPTTTPAPIATRARKSTTASSVSEEKKRPVRKKRRRLFALGARNFGKGAKAKERQFGKNCQEEEDKNRLREGQSEAKKLAFLKKRANILRKLSEKVKEQEEAVLANRFKNEAACKILFREGDTWVPFEKTKKAQMLEVDALCASKPAPQVNFSLKGRVKWEGISRGCVMPLCGKPVFLKMLQKYPALLETFFKKTLDNRKGEKVLIFIADGIPMAQQIGAFAKSLNRSLKQVTKAAEEISKLASEVVSKLDQEDQDRISFTTWNELLQQEAKYESWYNFIMENEKTREIVRNVAMDIISYRIGAFKKKGLKCANILDEEGRLLNKPKAKKRFGWTEESCGREIVTLIYGFFVKEKQQTMHYNSIVYMTPNSGGMDIISGGAVQILQLMRAEKMRDDLPKQSKLMYTEIFMH